MLYFSSGAPLNVPVLVALSTSLRFKFSENVNTVCCLLARFSVQLTDDVRVEYFAAGLSDHQYLW